MAHIPLVSCSSHAAVCYSREQAQSMVMDDSHLTVTVVQFAIFFADFTMSDLETNYAERLNMCIPSTL